MTGILWGLFLLFPPKKIFVKGLKFKKVQCFLKRKISTPCEMKIVDQNLWSYHISASSHLPTLHFPLGAPAPDHYLTCLPTCIHSGRLVLVSEASRGNLVLQGDQSILFRSQTDHTLGEQIDSTFLSLFEVLGSMSSPYSKQ